MLPFLVRFCSSDALSPLSNLNHTAVLVVSHFRDEETEIRGEEVTGLKSESNSLSHKLNPGLLISNYIPNFYALLHSIKKHP